jgi:Calpain family cysteine protease./F5/8 type C domain.
MKKNALMKRHFSLANSTKSFVRFFLASALAFNLSLFVSCSSDEDEPDDYKQTEVTNRPYSVVIYESNKNLPSSGTLVSEFSDSPVNSDISKAVDGKLPTNFVTKADNFYILFNADYPVLLTQYSITCAANEPEKDPKSWELFGSNNSQTWTTIDSQSNQSFSYRNQEKIYKLASNTKEYKYYKLQIKSNNGGKGVKIAELNLTGESTNIDDLIKKYAEGYSGSSSTPMGNHYASKHETTDVDRTWLADPENEPDVPNHVSHLTWKEQVVNLYPFGEPLPADVNQHSIGDCSALAVFASMAYIYPEFVKSLIKDNKDKTYTVAMFDPQGKAVSVTVSSKFLVDNNGTLQAATGKYNAATWATVLEKAIIKWNAIYKVNTDIGGIGSEHVAPLFTGDGYSYAFYPGKLTAKEMARVVKVHLETE